MLGGSVWVQVRPVDESTMSVPFAVNEPHVTGPPVSAPESPPLALPLLLVLPLLLLVLPLDPLLLLLLPVPLLLLDPVPLLEPVPPLELLPLAPSIGPASAPLPPPPLLLQAAVISAPSTMPEPRAHRLRAEKPEFASFMTRRSLFRGPTTAHGPPEGTPE